MIETEKILEWATPQDRCFDFCLWEYPPLNSPAGKLRSVNLLYKSFETAGGDPRFVDVCQVIREGIGPMKTVWGVKQVAGRLSWELYFYDYKRMGREVSIGKVVDLLAPYANCRLQFPEQRPYFMFSIDLDSALVGGQRDLDEINVYIGNPGSTVSSGICYALTDSGLALDNFYFFFDAASELDKAVQKAFCSAHLDPLAIDAREIFWPELTRCRIVVIANKKSNDGIYFSRVDVDQLLWFLGRAGYPAALVSFVEVNRQRFDHLHYDVAFDYAMEQGRLRILKSSFYGVF